MKLAPTAVRGVTIVEFDVRGDDRGSFRRAWCQREFAAAGLPGPIVQSSLSTNKNRGTLRGLHFQLPPSREGKLVQCVAGRIYDVALDLRAGSSSYLEHVGVELAADAPRAFFIPAGCAHGFLTLADNCTVLYMMTDFYDLQPQGGVRWNDPRFGIAWPEEPTEILPRDAGYPDYDAGLGEGFRGY